MALCCTVKVLQLLDNSQGSRLIVQTEINLCAPQARFERALIDLRRGECHGRTVEWDRDPTTIITGLLNGNWLVRGAKRGHYRTVIDPALREVVRIEFVE